MLSQTSTPWPVSQAKTHLSTLLRQAKAGQPQIIGTREQYVLMPLATFQKEQQLPIGTWLVQEGQKVGLQDDELVLPSRHVDRPVSLGED